MSGGLEGFEVGHAEFVVDGFDAFGAEALDFNEIEQALVELCQQASFDAACAGLVDFDDVFGDAFTDAIDVGQCLLFDVDADGLSEGFECPCGIFKSADFESIFALDLFEGADLSKYMRDVCVVHEDPWGVESFLVEVDFIVIKKTNLSGRPLFLFDRLDDGIVRHPMVFVEQL